MLCSTLGDMRRRWCRLLFLLVICTCIVVLISYHRSSSYSEAVRTNVISGGHRSARVELDLDFQVKGRGQMTPAKGCPLSTPAITTINTMDEYSKFDFQPQWMRGREFWDVSFERRYLQRQAQWKKLPLKVIIMPHSHADPGWLKTFEEYYFHQVSGILSNMVDKLTSLKTMTFVWSEISYLALWYDRAHPSNRDKLKELLRSGRLEILTGGWVMTDEANVNLYAMVSQLIEGHQWMKNTLDETAEHGWSIDPFGHGATVPYLLKESGINGTVIQRIHFIWKQWLAERQYGDFVWRQAWDDNGDTDVLVHNRPYDIYSIKHSCGPHPQICLNFDFRKVYGEYTEYSLKAVNIDERNVKSKAEQLLEQYGRTGSLYPHNVVLIPLGDDFRYDSPTEWDQQYENYRKIIEYINSDESYNAQLQFGTLKDYFNEVYKRTDDFPTLQGDFFVYNDIFTDGVPAHWSGYFTTRPYFKLLSRQLEGLLHTTELFYLAAHVSFEKKEFSRITQILEKDYEKLIKARQNLGLFQHHDAITGTSKGFVMHDYALKLHEGLQDCYSILSHAGLTLLATDVTLQGLKGSLKFDHLEPTFERNSYDKLPKPLPINMDVTQKLVVLTNSLAQRRYEMVKMVVLSSQIRITDEHGNNVAFQLNPIWSNTDDGMVALSSHFELVFIAHLPPLSMITYTIHKNLDIKNDDKMCVIYSNYYGSNQTEGASPFLMKDVIPGDIQIENDRLKLKFDGTSGMLTSVTDKESGLITQMSQYYGSYPSSQFRSGAYLFKTDPNSAGTDDDVLAGAKAHIFIQSGPISSEFTVMFGSVLMHSFKLFHVSHEPFAGGIYMENSFNLGSKYNRSETPGFSTNFRETELFFRFRTNINNGENPTFYTDQSGLSIQRRERVERIGIEGNYYPITAATYIQDDSSSKQRKRLTLLVDHAAGAASWKQGWIEVMIERRTLYDDSRGMGEGVSDQKRTIGRYWLLLEDLNMSEDVPRLSLAANQLSNLLNVPMQVFVLEGLKSNALKAATYLTTRTFPCSFHLLSLRSLSESQYPGLLPSKKALLTIQNQPPSCAVNSLVSTCNGLSDAVSTKTNLTLPVLSFVETSLTGVHEKKILKQLSDFIVPPHRVRSLQLTF